MTELSTAALAAARPFGSGLEAAPRSTGADKCVVQTAEHVWSTSKAWARRAPGLQVWSFVSTASHRRLVVYPQKAKSWLQDLAFVMSGAGFDPPRPPRPRATRCLVYRTQSALGLIYQTPLGVWWAYFELEPGRRGGPMPSDRRTVVPLLASLDLNLTGPDFGSFEVRVLHPARTLVEKLFAAGTLGSSSDWPVGRRGEGPSCAMQLLPRPWVATPVGTRGYGSKGQGARHGLGVRGPGLVARLRVQAGAAHPCARLHNGLLHGPIGADLPRDPAPARMTSGGALPPHGMLAGPAASWTGTSRRYLDVKINGMKRRLARDEPSFSLASPQASPLCRYPTNVVAGQRPFPIGRGPLSSVTRDQIRD
jgi:Nucleotidyl transferase AbiEii toxin, Type IV TA system